MISYEIIDQLNRIQCTETHFQSTVWYFRVLLRALGYINFNVDLTIPKKTLLPNYDRDHSKNLLQMDKNNYNSNLYYTELAEYFHFNL